MTLTRFNSKQFAALVASMLLVYLGVRHFERSNHWIMQVDAKEFEAADRTTAAKLSRGGGFLQVELKNFPAYERALVLGIAPYSS